MDHLTITIKLPDGVKAWLKSEGDPLYRSATEQAAYLCAQYLIGCFKREQKVTKNGAPLVSHDALDVS